MNSNNTKIIVSRESEVMCNKKDDYGNAVREFGQEKKRKEKIKLQLSKRFDRTKMYTKFS